MEGQIYVYSFLECQEMALLSYIVYSLLFGFVVKHIFPETGTSRYH